MVLVLVLAAKEAEAEEEWEEEEEEEGEARKGWRSSRSWRCCLRWRRKRRRRRWRRQWPREIVAGLARSGRSERPRAAAATSLTRKSCIGNGECALPGATRRASNAFIDAHAFLYSSEV